MQVDKLKDILTSTLQESGERLRFNELFAQCAEGIRGVYASQGDEYLRLRSYELLQELVATGRVQKDGRLYYAEGDANEPSQPE